MGKPWISLELGIDERVHAERDARDDLRWKMLSKFYDHFAAMRRASGQLATAGRKLRDLKAEWAKHPERGPCPYDGETYDTLRATRDAINRILEDQG